jgi:leucyl aminopeptidase (aminopeptidase T)
MDLSSVLQTCLGIKKSEKVLLLSDSEMRAPVGVIISALKPLTDKVVRLQIEPRRIHGEELPKAVRAAMKRSDVVIGATSKSMTHTLATKKAAEQGTRIASMPGISVEMLTKGGMTADYYKVDETAKKVSRILSNGSAIEIKTSVGTDFKSDISGREGWADTGILIKQGDFGNLPGGEGFIAPLEESSNGRIVFDGPIASSGLFHEPIIVDVKDGRAVSTNYEKLESVFKEFEKSRYVGEVGVGVNPKAKLIGNILEDEKALGTAHVAFGSNINFGGSVDAGIHLDGIIKKPTIIVDDKVLLSNGRLSI